MSPELEAWANSIGVKIGCWAGSGDFGEAFHTDCGAILKVTSHCEEFAAAMTLKDRPSDRAAKIYELHVTDSNEMVIVMELLDTHGIEDLWNQAEYYVSTFAFGEWDLFDVDEVPEHEQPDPVILEFIYDIGQAIAELAARGIDKPDIHPGNIGLSSNGYKLFDYCRSLPEGVGTLAHLDQFRRDLARSQHRQDQGSAATLSHQNVSVSP